MHLLIDFAQKIPTYNPRAAQNSDEDRKYWDWYGKKQAQLEKKHKTADVATQFENDMPVTVVKGKGTTYVYDSQGRLKQKVKQTEEPVRQPQQKRGWFW